MIAFFESAAISWSWIANFTVDLLLVQLEDQSCLASSHVNACFIGKMTVLITFEISQATCGQVKKCDKNAIWYLISLENLHPYK